MIKFFQYLLVFSGLLFAVQIHSAKLSGSYGNSSCSKFYIGIFQNGHYECIDSVTVDEKGRFETTIPENRKGTLLIACHNDKPADQALSEANNTSSLQFIYDGQDIVYETSWRWHNNADYLKVMEGGESTEVIKFLLEKQSDFHDRLASLEAVMDKTDKSSAFFQTITNEYAQAIKNYNQTVFNILSATTSGSLMEASVECLIEPDIPSILQGEDRINWLRQHFFDTVRLDNPMVYNSMFFANKIRQYLYIWQPKGIVSKSEIMAEKQEGINLLKSKVKSFDLKIQQAIEETINSVVKQSGG